MRSILTRFLRFAVLAAVLPTFTNCVGKGKAPPPLEAPSIIARTPERTELYALDLRSLDLRATTTVSGMHCNGFGKVHVDRTSQFVKKIRILFAARFPRYVEISERSLRYLTDKNVVTIRISSNFVVSDAVVSDSPYPLAPKAVSAKAQADLNVEVQRGNGAPVTRPIDGDGVAQEAAASSCSEIGVTASSALQDAEDVLIKKIGNMLPEFQY